MGLAAYGEPIFIPAVPRFEGVHFPLTFETGLTEIDRVWQMSGQPWHRFVKDRAADIAASGQQLLEEYMLALLNALNQAGAHATLCAAGGVFLNCQMNGRILTQTKFRQLHVVPAAGDVRRDVCRGREGSHKRPGEVKDPARKIASLQIVAVEKSSRTHP